MANNDSIKNTVGVAVLLCIVCSVIVSASAVLLRPAQKHNKELDINKNILMAAGIYEQGKSVTEQFKSIKVKLVDLETGKFTDAVDVATYDQRKAEKDPELSTDLSSAVDVANISSREQYSKVYLVEENGALKTIILPIRGYGLWSTLRGFLALDADLNTIKGLGYYEHGETPGLGGEVDNPKWKAMWVDKQAYDQSGDVAISVIKGHVDANTANAEHKVDGLSGATLTSKGVDNMMQFWLGENGFGPFISHLKNGEA